MDSHLEEFEHDVQVIKPEYLTPEYHSISRKEEVAIQSAVITETKTVKSFNVRVINLELFKSVSVSVNLIGEDGNSVGFRSFNFEGAEYLGWNNDDQYLIDCVAEKLGFTLA